MTVRGSLILSIMMAACVIAGASWAHAVAIDVRLYCEVSGDCGAGDFFFDNPQAVAALQFAAKAYEPFADSLTAIPASPSWTATFSNPDTGFSGATVTSLSVPTDTLILYAGGYDMPGWQVAEAAPGMANISLSRGQGNITGATASDFATWGGSIAFDTLDGGNPRNWHFGVDSLPAPGQVDFLTIAFHELAHVFGFGTAASFDNLVSGNHLLGAAVIGLTGSAPTLTVDNNHWAAATTSPPYANEPFSPLTASLLLGRRTELTPLDYAALRDLGWEVPDKLLGLHGDGNQDGAVDGRDFLAWQRGYGASGPNAGDFDGNLIVDIFDLWLWRGHNGARIGGSSLADSLQVPEPGQTASIVIALLLISGCPEWRSGRRHS